MATEWRQSTWGEEISLEYGKALRGHDTSSGAYRVYGSNGAIGWTDQPLAAGPGVVLGRKGAYRGVEYSPNPFFVIDTAYYVVSKREHDMRWLYYAIKHHKLGEIDDGSPIPSTTRAAVYPREVEIPPLTEQRAIAHILGTLDDKIELNRRMSATLEAMARAIFQDWFVDFGPTRAKMEGRPHYLAPDLWSLFPDRLDAEGKPEGWVPRPLSTIAAIGRETVSPASMPDEAFDHYSIPAFDAGRTPVRELGTGILSNKTLVPHGAVLLSKLNPEIPRVWLVDADPSVRSICSTEFLVLSSIEEANRAFLYSVVTDPGFRRRMEAQVTGTSKSHQRVKPQSVLDAEVLLPPPNVLAVFQQRATPLLDRVLANQRESRTLAATRDLLLPRLMSGELRVRDAERFLERAT